MTRSVDLHHRGPATGCPCTIWPTTATPATPATNDTSAVEVGVKFRTSQAGYITGLRFYKGTGNTGTHTGSLWTATGTGSPASPSPAKRDRLAAGDLRAPVAVDREHHLRRVVPRAGRPLRGQQLLRQRRDDHGTADRAAERHRRRQRRLPLRRQRASRTAPTSRRNYWVDVVFDTTATDTTAPTVAARRRPPAPAECRDQPGDGDLLRAGRALDGRGASGPGTPRCRRHRLRRRQPDRHLHPERAAGDLDHYTVTVSGAKDAPATRWPRSPGRSPPRHRPRRRRTRARADRSPSSPRAPTRTRSTSPRSCAPRG